MKRVAVFLAAFCAIAGATAAEGNRIAELRHLLLHDCGSCHGMTLKGGLGPSLRPEALAVKSDELLRMTILDGRAGTPMPPWRGILSEADVIWLVQALRQGDTHE